jgi:hypothetical protein
MFLRHKLILGSRLFDQLSDVIGGERRIGAVQRAVAHRKFTRRVWPLTNVNSVVSPTGSYSARCTRRGTPTTSGCTVFAKQQPTDRACNRHHSDLHRPRCCVNFPAISSKMPVPGFSAGVRQSQNVAILCTNENRIRPSQVRALSLQWTCGSQCSRLLTHTLTGSAAATGISQILVIERVRRIRSELARCRAPLRKH